ncbi:MAG: TlpA family protein disulfide reductase [Cytophagales bacterium]|nr:TlpA family protein disulfide reductase [Cytophagales bacterium]
MKKHIKKLVISFYIISNVVISIAQTDTTSFKAAKDLFQGSPAPDFTLKSNQRDTLSLSDFRGKVVYLQFWASWCAVCKQQIPYAKFLQNELQGKDVVFLYISVDENELGWLKTIKKRNMEGVHLYSGGFDSEVAQSYDLQATPTCILIDKQGNIAFNPAKYPSQRGLLEDIERLLEE